MTERTRLDCVREANHNLNRLLDKPVQPSNKYLFESSMLGHV